MGKTRTTDRRTSHKITAKKAKRNNADTIRYDPEAAGVHLQEAQYSFSVGELETALKSTQKALKSLQSPATRIPSLGQLPAWELLGAIYVELGDARNARTSFEYAAQVDPNGQCAGAEKFLWLAQLSEDGGLDTVRWFEKGITCLRTSLQQAREEVENDVNAADNERVGMITEKLSRALCSVAEVYMTDLSFEDDCEAKCEAFVTEATEIAPTSPSALQTLANVRISQQRIDEARTALEKSLSIWETQHKNDGDENTHLEGDILEQRDDEADIPEFATRISLCRLLMEVNMCQRALGVLERLVLEDDTSVEAWYLGGWCQHLLACANEFPEPESDHSDDATKDWFNGCAKWLQRCLEEFRKQDYEDDRLRDHTLELLNEVNGKIRPGEGGRGDEDAWEAEGLDDPEMLTV